jgi:hypothetical protein
MEESTYRAMRSRRKKGNNGLRTSHEGADKFMVVLEPRQAPLSRRPVEMPTSESIDTLSSASLIGIFSVPIRPPILRNAVIGSPVIS